MNPLKKLFSLELAVVAAIALSPACKRDAPPEKLETVVHQMTVDDPYVECRLYEGKVNLEFLEPSGAYKMEYSCENGLPHGPVVGYFGDGTKMVEGTIRTGIADGPQTTWYPNGVKRSEITFHEGKKHGQLQQWYPNGQLQLEFNVDHGIPHGVQRFYSPDGELIMEESFDHGTPAPSDREL